jgi:outer membrane immunogenic protein
MKTTLLLTASGLLLSGAALAADLPTKKAPPPPAPPPVWQGLYAGLNAGGIWANPNSLNNLTSWNETTNAQVVASSSLLAGSVPASGTAAFLGGGQIGYNYQFDNVSKLKFLAGVEADIQGVAPTGTTGARSFVSWGSTQTAANTVLVGQSASNYLSYIGSVRGRAGIILIPSVLVYGTGGLAYGGANASLQNFAGWSAAWQGGSTRYSNTQVGWTAGGGVEWLFRSNWSVKAEYLYYDLGKASGSVQNIVYPLNGSGPFAGSITQFTSRFSGNILRAGVNYHFTLGNAPVVAKF